MTFFRNISISFFCFFVSAFVVNAKKNVLYCGIYEDITYNCIDNLDFTIINNESDVMPIDSIIAENEHIYQIVLTVPDGDYTLLIEKDGYYPCVKPFKKTGRVGVIGLGSLFMKKQRVKSLDEVTVTATRVKMVMRGDTVVYDAGAFELAEGSMLDALVAQLPGTELKDGRISVNGKFVESLLINGEDFFAGNPRIALENLPAYTVKNIKV